MGLGEYLRHCEVATRHYVRGRKAILTYGCIETQSVRNRMAAVAKVLLEQAPLSNGETQLCALSVEMKDNPRGSYVIGDFKDVVTLYHDAVKGHVQPFSRPTSECPPGLYWTGLQEKHIWVPYVDIDAEFVGTVCSGMFKLWPIITKAIDKIHRTLCEQVDEKLELPFQVSFNHRKKSDTSIKLSWHIHFYTIGIENILAWRTFLQKFAFTLPSVDGTTTVPMFDMNVYGGTQQLFRGPGVKKFGDDAAIMHVVDIQCDQSQVRWKKQHLSVVHIANACIRVPPSYIVDKIELKQRVPVALSVRPAEHTMSRTVPEGNSSNAFIDFWAPLITYEILPKWQSFRHTVAEAMGVDAYVPTKNLQYSCVCVTPDKPWRITYCVSGDVYCETDEKHIHSQANKLYTRVCIDLQSCTVQQSCRACGTVGPQYSFLQRGGAVKVGVHRETAWSELHPLKQVWPEFVLSYYRNKVIMEADTHKLWVYDDEYRIWRRVAQESRMVLRLIFQLNNAHRSYIEALAAFKCDEMSAAASTETARDKIVKDSKKFIDANTPLISVSDTGRAKIGQTLDCADADLPTTEMDCFPHYIPMKNGEVFDVFTGNCMPITKDMYITSLCNAQLTNDKKEMEELKEWLNEITCGDKEKQTVLLRYAAYFMTYLVHDRRFVVFQGNGKNGKGQFKSFLVNILNGPPAARCSRAMVFNADYWAFSRNNNAEAPSPMTHAMKHKTLYYTDDMPAISINTGRLKTVVASEVATGRELYSKPEKVLPLGKVLWTTNHYLKIPGDDKACWDRYVLLKFMATYVATPAEVDVFNHRYPQDRTRSENQLLLLDAFFTLAVRELSAYYAARGNSVLGCLPLSDQIVADIKLARHMALPLARFMDGHTAVSNEPLSWVTVTLLFENYLNYLDRDNEIRERRGTTQQAFIDLLASALDIAVTPQTQLVRGRMLVKSCEPLNRSSFN